MRTTDWERLDPLLERLLALPVAEAEAEIERLAESDAPLCARLRAALGAAREASSWLDRPAAERWAPLLAGAAAAATPAPATGTVCGSWRIGELLGRGGMGAVYAAERVDGGFEQRAAIKLLRADVDDPKLHERFARERQILARLEHPAIARLLDGGVAADGYPYLVLERVDGEAITAWCDTRRLDVHARLRLFVSALDAVEYAHRSLVVHRDLKPSNILVSDEGAVKLLDFGIAKLLSEDEVELTRTRAAAPLTPQYAAPEQVTGAPVTTGTDVYSLGVVLYELLAGARPYRLESDSALELERHIVAGETLPPSQTAARLDAAALAGRAATPARLALRLAGDLDAVVLRALAKEPERRYASVAALRQDLESHLAGRPVAARPDSLAYRTRKFIRRHRFGVAASAALALLLVGALAATATALRASHARLAEARRAEAIKEFLVETLAEADPAQGTRSERTLSEVLETGEKRLATALADQPRTRAELALTLGTIERNLGHFDRAETLLGEARTLTEQEFGAESPELARVLLSLGGLSYWKDDYQRAAEIQRRAVHLFEAAGPDYRADLGDAHFNVGIALRQLGRYDEAIAEERQALAIDQEVYGADHLESAACEEGLALLLHSAGRDAEGVPLIRHALEVRRRQLAADHPDIAGALEALGLLEGELGEFDEAISALEDALEIRRRAYGREHPQVVESLNSLAATLIEAGRAEEAVVVRREAWELARTVYAGADSSLATEANNFAVLCYRLRDWACAESGFREALTAWRRVHGDHHPAVASGVNNLGMALLALGQSAEALPAVEEGLAIRREVFGEESSAVAQSLRNLGLVELALGHLSAARRALDESVALSRRVYPDRHPRLAEALAARAELALAEHRQADALRDLEEGLAIRNEKLGPDNALTLELRSQLASAKQAVGGR